MIPPEKSMRVVLAILLLLPLAGCEIVYKLSTRQGNVIEQKDLDKLSVGMTREQVQFIMGTPIASSALRQDRWDYYGYYKPPRGKPYTRTVSLWFDGEKLVRLEGEKPLKNDKTKPDLETIEAEQHQAESEKQRAKEEKKSEGGIITPPDQQEHKDGGGTAGTGGSPD